MSFFKPILLIEIFATFSIGLGNIATDKISVEPGAKFTGSCKMGEAAPAKDEKKK